jgi:hypothetical protein
MQLFIEAPALRLEALTTALPPRETVPADPSFPPPMPAPDAPPFAYT